MTRSLLSFRPGRFCPGNTGAIEFWSFAADLFLVMRVFKVLSVLCLTLTAPSLMLPPRAQAEGIEDQANQLRYLVAELIEASGRPQPEQALATVLSQKGDAFYLFLNPELLKSLAGIAELPGFEFSWDQIGKSLSETIFTAIHQVLNRDPPLLHRTDVALPLALKSAIFLFSELPETQREEVVRHLPKSVLVLLGKKIRAHLSALTFSALPWVSRITDTRYFNGHSAEHRANQAIKAILKDYFDAMPLALKSNMAAAYLKVSVTRPFSDKIGSILLLVNPIVQKLFQLLGKKLNDRELALAMEVLQDSLKPIPFAELKNVFETRTGQTWDTVFRDTETERMRRATTGQVVFAVLQATGEKVAVKVRIPGLKERLAQSRQELLSLPSIRDNVGIKNSFTSIINKIEEEIDYRYEAKITDAVQDSYRHPDLGIIPIARALKEVLYEDLVVYRFATGKKGSSLLTADELPLRAELTRNLVHVWFESAFFRVVALEGVPADSYSTVFHGDLHSGNYLIDLPHKTLTVLDFGNVGVFSIEMRQNFMVLFVATLDSDPERFLKTTMALFPFSADRMGEARIALDETWQRFTSPMVRFESAISKLVDQIGVELPGSITSMVRAVEFLRRETDEINLKLKELGPDFDKHRIDLASTMARVFLQHLAQDWFDTVFGKKDAAPQLVPLSLLRDAAVLYIGSRFASFCSTLFSRGPDGGTTLPAAPAQ